MNKCQTHYILGIWALEIVYCDDDFMLDTLYLIHYKSIGEIM